MKLFTGSHSVFQKLILSYSVLVLATSLIIGSATLTDISDSYYQANVGFPYKINIGPDGYIYISMNGTGIHIGLP